MSKKVLIAYTTRYGSTREVAEAIAATLQENGLQIELQPMRKVQVIENVQAVILGAPIYIGNLQKDFGQFLNRHQQVLTGLPVGVFALGPISEDEKEWAETRTQLEKTLEKYPWFKPAAVELFGGKYDPAKLRFPDNLLLKFPASPLHDLPARDVRNWDAIQDWAKQFAAALS